MLLFLLKPSHLLPENISLKLINAKVQENTAALIFCSLNKILPTVLKGTHTDAAQILWRRILVLIFDWLCKPAMTSHYVLVRHVPWTNGAGEMASCEAPGIPLGGAEGPERRQPVTPPPWSEIITAFLYAVQTCNLLQFSVFLYES